MSAVFDSQFLDMQGEFAREGIDIQVAYTPAGEDDYVYQEGRLLAVEDAEVIRRIQDVLTGTRRAEQGEQPRAGGLVVLSIADLEGGRLTVPQALDILDEYFGEENPAVAGGVPLVTPVHVMHITGRLCAPTEPEVPCPCEPAELCPPCPPQAADGGEGVLIGVCDTGLVQGLNTVETPWLAKVTGEADQLEPGVPGGLAAIQKYGGHGTFAAGVAACEAPQADVYVANHFTKSGGELEYVIVDKLEQLIADQSPAVVNLSAGGYTRKDWVPLSFTAFSQRGAGGITLTASAGNDGTCRPFWPAAFDWAVAVGALGADGRHRAWFTNFGDWVDVYALGEGMVNAFAAGVYTYQEPPKRPAQQTFNGRARWCGTSFSAPLVAGLIAAQMSQAGMSAYDAKQTLLEKARSQRIDGVGPVLFPR